MGVYAITGAASGMGLATAELLRAGGHRVVGIDLKDAEVCADLSTAEGRASLTEAVGDLLGGEQLAGALAAAGLGSGSLATVKVNYFGVVGSLHALRPLMARGANAVAIASVAAAMRNLAELVECCLGGDEPGALESAQRSIDAGRAAGIYPSTKAAVARWVRREAAGADWAGAGVSLNAVAPGLVATAMTREQFADPAVFASMKKAVPMPLREDEVARPEEVARLIHWLLGPENTLLTGQVIYADLGADATLRSDAVW